MATTTKWYGNGVKNVMSGAIDLDTDTIHISLHTNTYTPNQDTDDFFNDATNELTTANGYTAGGVTLAGKTVTYDSGTNEARFDCTDPSWTFTASVTFRHAVIYKKRGGAATADELIGYITWDADQTVSGVYTLVVDTTGLLKITAA